MSGGATLMRPLRIAAPATAPSAPPVATSSACSTRSWRIRLHRLPPIAARTANSCARDAPPVQEQAGEVHASDEQQQRHGTREHGQRCRHVLTTRSASGTTATPLPLLVSGYSQASAAARPASSARADVTLNSRLSTADGVETGAVAAALHTAVVRRHLRFEQEVDVGWCHVTKAWRQDADHGV